MNDLLFISTAEVCRYLGIKNTAPDESLRALIDRAIVRVRQEAVPRHVARTVSLTVGKEDVAFGTHTVHTADLAKHLQGCDRAILFAATLGSKVDRLLLRDSVVQPSLAVTEQAAAAALIESYCDVLCEELERPLRGQQLHLRPRFSPGYGDYPLEEQPYLLKALDAAKSIGLTHTDSLMLTPVKSITAVIGVGKGQARCYSSGCTMCSNLNCLFRKEEDNLE